MRFLVVLLLSQCVAIALASAVTLTNAYGGQLIASGDLMTQYTNVGGGGGGGGSGDITNGLVGWWKFNEGSGATAADSSGNGRDGTLTDGATFSSGSVQLDGTNDCIIVGDYDAFSFGNGTTDSPFSISAWVYLVDDTFFPILTKWNILADAEYSLYVARGDFGSIADRQSQAQLNQQGVTFRFRKKTVASLALGWNHVVMTYNGSGSPGVAFFNDGAGKTAEVSESSYTAMTNRSAPLMIGALLRGDSSNKIFAKGKIDDVRIYNRVLTPTEISTLYANGAK